MTLQALALTALLAFHYRNVLYGLYYNWLNNGDWSHGFVIPVFSLYYLYTQRHRLPLDLPDHGVSARALGAMLITLGFALHMACTVYQIDYPKKLALVMSILGVVLMVCGWPVTRWSWFAVAFLVFRSQVSKPVTGSAGLVGEIGVVRKTLAPRGKVFVHGELWNAVAPMAIDENVPVRVVKVTGLLLEVEPADGGPRKA